VKAITFPQSAQILAEVGKALVDANLIKDNKLKKLYGPFVQSTPKVYGISHRQGMIVTRQLSSLPPKTSG
jgi:hypothetical protein